ncbi:NAD(P)/FAD-dependent oxidoreductase [Bacteriovorax sp. PP10]|uniref:NAD(P)/FAD-dependent oxidoreductase n=1 Tax=Bacteriovorax antarcticus TaxID=3088717 RepID=A0ABU5VTQ4_9BACT|nr:NAD(P)/FAD-dependent oxidoreductase [Bacteriovorax sp. PP10]MEA9355778.1 NAD(P)/FAD-dependent oxidoreductase [Bacteriovorax sp. PP10]
MSLAKLENNKLKIGIVGAGPAGSMSAYFLASQGHAVTLFERKKEVERKVCGEYLCPEGVRLLEELNLFDRLCAGFEELNGMVLVSPTNISIPSYFPQTDKKKVNKGLSLNRKIFDQRLLGLALETGAVLLKDTTVTRVVQNTNQKWTVIANEENYEFDLLIAADGRQSKIGHTLKHLKFIDTKRAAIHCYLSRKVDRGQRLGEMHILNENRYCGLDPISDDEVNFSVVCDSKRLKKNTPQNIINEVLASSIRLNQMFDPVDDNTEIKVVTSLKNKNLYIAGNGLAYVGDAAGFIDPLTGEGIYNALLTSKLLKESIEQSENMNHALALYKRKKNNLSFQKNILNNFFQFLIKRPLLVNLTAVFLKKSQKRANHFIGIIGNIHGPLTGFIKMLKA